MTLKNNGYYDEQENHFDITDQVREIFRDPYFFYCWVNLLFLFLMKEEE